MLGAINEIKGSGTFVSSATRPFVFPGLEVRGVEEIGFPLSVVQAKALIKAAHQAPFGKGSQTVVDTRVRSTWEIDASEITFNNPDWATFITGVLDDIKPDLGLVEQTIGANLYKLLIYEEGGFFLPHQDSEKEPGMFGTLVVGLPARHTGGALVVRFDGHETTVDFSEAASNYKIPYAAFYADCEHEIKPVASGYRVCLVYNLIQTKGKAKIQSQALSTSVEKLSQILKASEDDPEIPKIVLLGHQYTPSNFTMESLKLSDRPKAHALLEAAEKAGFYAKLGLVTSYQSGELQLEQRSTKGRGRRNYYYDEYDDDAALAENGTMGEVYDEYITSDHWMAGGIPPLCDLEFEESDLIKNFDLNEGEPAEKAAEGYTGNAGMEMQYWYHYGAVFLWPKKYNADLVSATPLYNQMEWVNYYNQRWQQADSQEKDLARQLIAQLPVYEKNNADFDFSPLGMFFVHDGQETLFAEKGLTLLQGYFKFISVETWGKLFESYPASYFEPLFDQVAALAKLSVTDHLLSLLCFLDSSTQAQRSFVAAQIEKVPAYLQPLKLTSPEKKTTAGHLISRTVALSQAKATDAAWIAATVQAFTRTLTRDYVNDVLVKTLFSLKNTDNPLVQALLVQCRNDLLQRVSNKPQPPADWSRPVPQEPKRYRKVWDTLADFLQSPTEKVFLYQKVAADRAEMEEAIANVKIDLDKETIRKGSPHTLKLTKNQANYERELAMWHTDEDLLKKVEKAVSR